MYFLGESRICQVLNQYELLQSSQKGSELGFRCTLVQSSLQRREGGGTDGIWRIDGWVDQYSEEVYSKTNPNDAEEVS